MKKLVKKLGMVLVVISMVVVGLVGCGKSEASSDDGEVVIGYDNTYFPMGFLDDNGDTVGFDVDLAKKTFDKLGMKVKFQSIDWSMKETELRNDTIDWIG